MIYNRLKVVTWCVFVLFIGALSSCQESTSTTINAKHDENSRNITPKMAVFSAFSCKPRGYAFVAAHRGTHKGSKYPENALESLQALNAKGIMFAEIDIARLKDGTLILHHDGTWDRGSTGTGLIATQTWDSAEKLLLRDTNGKITIFRPSKFRDVLKWAKHKMYLEIDFKSSVTEAKVVDAIKAEDMLEQVILISYSKSQALRLHKLAPTAAISVKISKPGDIKAYELRGIPTNMMLAWTGRAQLSKKLVNNLRSWQIPILASGDFSKLSRGSQLPDLIVTNYALNVPQVFVIKGKNLKNYEKCMVGKNK